MNQTKNLPQFDQSLQLGPHYSPLFRENIVTDLGGGLTTTHTVLVTIPGGIKPVYKQQRRLRVPKCVRFIGRQSAHRFGRRVSVIPQPSAFRESSTRRSMIEDPNQLVREHKPCPKRVSKGDPRLCALLDSAIERARAKSSPSPPPSCDVDIIRRTPPPPSATDCQPLIDGISEELLFLGHLTDDQLLRIVSSQPAQGWFDGMDLSTRISAFKETVVNHVTSTLTSAVTPDFAQMALDAVDWRFFFKIVVCCHLLYRCWDDRKAFSLVAEALAIAAADYSELAAVISLITSWYLSGDAERTPDPPENGQAQADEMTEETEQEPKGSVQRLCESFHELMCRALGFAKDSFAWAPAVSVFALFETKAGKWLSIARLFELLISWLSAAKEWLTSSFYSMMGWADTRSISDAQVAQSVADFYEATEKALNTPNNKPDVKRVRLAVAHRVGEKLSEMMSKIRNLTMVGNIATRVGKLETAIEQLDYSTNRIEPIHWNFVGQPGVGKTYAVNKHFIPAMLAGLYGIDPVEHSKYVFSKASGSPYWETYDDATLVIVINELYGSARPESMMADMLDLVSTTQYVCNMAEAPDKGKVAFKAPIIMSGANLLVDSRKIQELAIDKGAFKRRRRPVAVRYKPTMLTQNQRNAARWDRAMYINGDIYRPTRDVDGRPVTGLEAIEFAIIDPEIDALDGNPYQNPYIWQDARQFLIQHLLPVTAKHIKDQTALANPESLRSNVEALMAGVNLDEFLIEGALPAVPPSVPHRAPVEHDPIDDIVEEFSPSEYEEPGLAQADEAPPLQSEYRAAGPERRAELLRAYKSLCPNITGEEVLELSENGLLRRLGVKSSGVFHMAISFIQHKLKSSTWIPVVLLSSALFGTALAVHRFWCSYSESCEVGEAQSGNFRPAKQRVIKAKAKVARYTLPENMVAGKAQSAAPQPSVLEKVERNMVILQYGDIRCIGLALAGRWILAPYHQFIPHIQSRDGYTRDIRISFGPKTAMNVRSLPMPLPEHMIVSMEGDYVIFELKQLPSFPTIIQHILPSDSIDINGKVAGCMVTRDRNTGNVIQRDLQNLSHGGLGPMTYDINNVLFEVPASDCLRYTVNSFPGDCGSPVFVVHQGRTRVAGIHAMKVAAERASLAGARLMPPSEVLNRLYPHDTPGVAQSGPSFTSLSEITVDCTAPCLNPEVEERAPFIGRHDGPVCGLDKRPGLTLTSHAGDWTDSPTVLAAIQHDVPFWTDDTDDIALKDPVYTQMLKVPKISSSRERAFVDFLSGGKDLFVAYISRIPNLTSRTRELSDHETINGCSGVEPMNLAGSIGWPNSGPKRAFMDGDQGDCSWKPEVMEDVQFFLDNLSNPDCRDERALAYAGVMKKIETLPIAKVLPGLTIREYRHHKNVFPGLPERPDRCKPASTRQINNFNVAVDHAGRKIYAAPFSNLRDKHNERYNPFGAGWCPYSPDVEVWKDQLRSEGFNLQLRVLLNADARSFDKVIPPPAWGHAFRVVNEALGRSNKTWRKRADGYINRIQNTQMVIGSEVFRASWWLSGIFGTEIGGTSVMAQLFMAQIVKDNPDRTISELVEAIWIKGIGDDVNFLLKSGFKFDLPDFLATCSSFQLELTNPDKTGPPEWTTWDDFDFCSRSLRHDGILLHPLKKESWSESCFIFKQRHMSDEESFRNAVRNAELEAVIWGAHEYEKLVYRVNRIVDAYGYDVQIRNFGDVWAHLLRIRESPGLYGFCAGEYEDPPEILPPPDDTDTVASHTVTGVAQGERVEEAKALANTGTAALQPTVDAVERPEKPNIFQSLAEHAATGVGMGAAAAVFGLCHPRRGAESSSYIPRLIDPPSHGVGESHAVSLGVDANNVTELGSQYMGDGDSSTFTIESIQERLNYVDEASWASTDSTQAVIMGPIPITPMLCQFEQYSPPNRICRWTPRACIGMQHQAWSGGELTYQFELINPQGALQSGSCTAFVNYGSDTPPTNADYQALISKNTDLGKNRFVTETVKFMGTRVMYETWMPTAVGFNYHERAHLGTIWLIVTNPIVGTTSIDDVKVKLWFTTRNIKFHYPTMQKMCGVISTASSSGDVRERAERKRIEAEEKLQLMKLDYEEYVKTGSAQSEVVAGTTTFELGQATITEESAAPTQESASPAMVADDDLEQNMKALERPVHVTSFTPTTGSSDGVLTSITLISDWLSTAMVSTSRLTYYRWIRIGSLKVWVQVAGTATQAAGYMLVWAPMAELDPTTANENPHTLSGFPNAPFGPSGETPALDCRFINVNAQVAMDNPNSGDEYGKVLIVQYQQLFGILSSQINVEFQVWVQASDVRPVGPTTATITPLTRIEYQWYNRMRATGKTAREVNKVIRTYRKHTEDAMQKAIEYGGDLPLSVALDPEAYTRTGAAQGEDTSSAAEDGMIALQSRPTEIPEPQGGSTNVDDTGRIGTGEDTDLKVLCMRNVWAATVPTVHDTTGTAGPIGMWASYFDVPMGVVLEPRSPTHLDLVQACFRAHRGGTEYTFVIPRSLDVNRDTMYYASLYWRLDGDPVAFSSCTWSSPIFFPTHLSMFDDMDYRGLMNGGDLTTERVQNGLIVGVPYYYTGLCGNNPVWRNANAIFQGHQGATKPILRVYAVQEYVGTTTTNAWAMTNRPSVKIFKRAADDYVCGFPICPVPISIPASQYDDWEDSIEQSFFPVDI